MNILKKIIIIIISILLQGTFLIWFEIKHVKPDLVLAVVVCVALIDNVEQSTIFGFCAGLVEDILCGGILGLNALTKTIIGFTISQFNKNLYNANIIIQALISFLATILHGVIIYSILENFQFNVSWTDNFLNILFPAAFYNVLLTILIFSKINNWIKVQRLV
ncbi:rod shape-determining protein MreD [Candidatus Poribacteria bacterium]|nr:rod shape-determining protein MreD [Candidatus Poribacteria bacterium]